MPGLGVAGFHDLHYVEWGRRNNKRVVVCAHGFSGNARDFDPLARELARDARVIAIDVAGRGGSAWLPAAPHYHFGQFLSDIRAVLARLGAREVEWVGTSMGGLLGMMLASQTRSPVRRLVMNDVGAFLPLEALQQIARNLEAPARFDSLEAVEAHLRHTHREWGEISDLQYRELAVHHSRALEGGGFRLHYDPQITRVVKPLPFTTGIHLWNSWYRVRCPVLLIRGEHSRIFPQSVADTMLEVNPDARLAEVPGAGHAPALMSAGEIGMVRGFLAEKEAQRSEPRDARAAAGALRAKPA